MTYDFFASKSDKINLLNFIFNETDLKLFDLGSLYGQEISEYKSTEEIVSRFDLENGEKAAVTFQLWSSRFGGTIQFRKVNLNPKYCGGHTFRYSTEGWGLVQLYFSGQKDNTLYPSHIGHYNEKGALKWEQMHQTSDRVDNWNWKEIERTSRQLKNRIHNRISSRKIGSYGVLPGADELINAGTMLWGVNPLMLGIKNENKK